MCRIHADKGDIVALLFEHALKLFKIEIALERVGTLPVKPVFLQTDNVVAAAVFDFADRGAELEVHRNDRTGLGLYERKRKHMFTGAALMNGKKIILVENLFDFGSKAIIGCTAGIAVVADHHRAELFVGHCVDAAVGQHVEVNILAAEAV